MNGIAPLTKSASAFEAGRPRADNENIVLRSLGSDFFGMPATPPLLARRGILGAADRRVNIFRGHADIAANALAYVLVPPLFDFPGQKGSGDRRPCRADEIENSPLDLGNHCIGRSEAAGADHGLTRYLLGEGVDGFLISLRVEVGGA